MKEIIEIAMKEWQEELTENSDNNFTSEWTEADFKTLNNYIFKK